MKIFEEIDETFFKNKVKNEWKWNYNNLCIWWLLGLFCQMNLDMKKKKKISKYNWCFDTSSI